MTGYDRLRPQYRHVRLPSRPRGLNLKEQPIGRRVCGRAPDYSSGEDNIVPVEVRHLRMRLEYFAGERKSEPVVIVIRKGGYVPEFEPREVLPAVAPPRRR
jgi:hypothetical protein